MDLGIIITTGDIAAGIIRQYGLATLSKVRRTRRHTYAGQLIADRINVVTVSRRLGDDNRAGDDYAHACGPLR